MISIFITLLWIYVGLIFAAEIIRDELDNFGILIDDTIIAVLIMFFAWPFLLPIGFIKMYLDKQKLDQQRS